MKIKKDKYEKTDNLGQRCVIQPEHVKRQAVKELEAGEITLQMAMRKYEIRSRGTIRKWLMKYSDNPEIHKPRTMHPIAVKQQAVREIEMGLITRQQVANKLNVSRSNVAYWQRKYSSDISSMKNTDKQNSSPNNDGKSNQELEDAKLKIAALETMIDIAEEQFKIQIRKKPGTKQSNK